MEKRGSFSHLLSELFDVSFSSLLTLRVIEGLNNAGLEQVDISELSTIRSHRRIAGFAFRTLLIGWGLLLVVVFMASLQASGAFGAAVLLAALPLFVFGALYIRIAIEAGLIILGLEADPS